MKYIRGFVRGEINFGWSGSSSCSTSGCCLRSVSQHEYRYVGIVRVSSWGLEGSGASGIPGLALGLTLLLNVANVAEVTI